MWTPEVFPSAQHEGSNKITNLLKYIIKMWNPEQQYFEVGEQILIVEVEEILTSPWGKDVTTQGLNDQYCFPRTQMNGKKIPMKYLMDLPLRTILFTMQWVSRSHGSHQASRAHMLYSLEEMTPTLINWEEDFLVVLKYHLTKCRRSEMKQFG